MRSLCLPLLFAALCCLPGSFAEANARTVLVLGDSISAAYEMGREEGWVALLEARLAVQAPGWRVVNASVSGETTGGGLARLPAALTEHDPELVLIELGGNDALRGYPLEQIRANLDSMVRAAEGRRVLVLGMQIPPNYGPRYARGFAGLFQAVAEAHGASYAPFLLEPTLEQVALDPKLMQSDGIHPNAAAQPTLLDAVWPHLQPLLTD